MCGRLGCLWADGGYAGQLVNWVSPVSRGALQIVRRSDPARGFFVLPWRWVVERTFGWLGRSRRLSRDYERQAQVAEAFADLAICRLMQAALLDRLNTEDRQRWAEATLKLVTEFALYGSDDVRT